MPIDQAVWGQILLAFTTGFISLTTTIVGFVLWRSKVTLNRRLEQQQADNEIALEKERAKHELEKKQFEAVAQERVLAAEQDIRSIANQQAAMANQQIILTQLLELLRDAGKRTDEKDSRVQVVLGQLLDSGRESTDTLKIHNAHLLKLVDGLGDVQTNVGESVRVLALVQQVVSGLPTQLDTRTSPLTEAIASMVRRVDTLIDNLETAKQQLIRDLIAAIRDVQLDAVREAVTALIQSPQPLTPTEGQSS